MLRDLRHLESVYQEALMLYRKLAKEQPRVYEPNVAMMLNNLGTVLKDLHHLESAEAAYQEALTLYRSCDIPDQMAAALSNLSRLLMGSKRWKESAGLLKEAKEKVERLRVETLSLDRRMQIFRENIHIYENLLVCLMKLKRTEEALVVAEAGKSRTLADLLTMRDQVLHNVPGELADEYNRMLFRARALVESQIQQGGAETSRMELVKTHSRLQELVEAIRKHDPDFLPHARTLSLKEIRELAKDAQSTIVLFRVTEWGSFVFLVFPDSKTDSLEVPEFTTKTLNDLLTKFEGAKVAEGWIVRYYDYRAANEQERETKRQAWLDAMDITLGKLYEHLLKSAHQFIHERLKEKTYLFSWDEIQGSDDGIFLEFLEQNLCIDWIKTADIEKIDDKTIRVSTKENSLLIGLNDEKTKVNLIINDGRTDEFVVKTEYGKLNVYRKTPLVLVPNRGLAILPLHACWWKENGNRHYLMDEFVIRYAPSLSIFKRCLERERTGSSPEMLLGVANPYPPGNLVFSEWECQEIERMLGSERCSILWKDKATKKELMQRASARTWQWLHFSCHGQYRLDAPLESAIYFAGGEALTLGEIFEGMYLPEAWLVILSACETGLVDFRDIADEHYGLPAGFLYAGAATVYSSLWMVNDLSTALLMRRVYEDLMKEVKGKPDALCKAQALNKAQRWLRDVTAGELAKILAQEELELGRDRMTWTQIVEFTREMKYGYKPDDRPFNHPYWWAGFQNVGV